GSGREPRLRAGTRCARRRERAERVHRPRPIAGRPPSSELAETQPLLSVAGSTGWRILMIAQEVGSAHAPGLTQVGRSSNSSTRSLTEKHLGHGFRAATGNPPVGPTSGDLDPGLGWLVVTAWCSTAMAPARMLRC